MYIYIYVYMNMYIYMGIYICIYEYMYIHDIDINKQHTDMWCVWTHILGAYPFTGLCNMHLTGNDMSAVAGTSGEGRGATRFLANVDNGDY